jgi:serine/threonine protein kinase
MNFFTYYKERSFVAFNEQQSRNIFKQLAKAVSHVHKKDITHLDIKLDNIMIDPETHSVKLIDFGLCNFATKENNGKFNYRVGSEEYWAPEMIAEKIEAFDGFKVDVWCLGMVLYCLLNASFPFNPKKRTNYVRSTGAHPTFRFTQPISTSAQDLIKKMLEVNPDTRLSLSEVMSHPWMKKSQFPMFWKN